MQTDFKIGQAASRRPMHDQSYRSFLRELEECGELIRFTKEVDPLRNLSAIEWKAYNELGKASLFTNIAGHAGWSVCSQIIADRRKWAIGLGMREENLIEEIGDAIKHPIAPVRVGRSQAPVKEVVLLGEDADLRDLPSVVVSEGDPGRFITAGIAIIKDPETGLCNMSLHRQQIKGKHITGFTMAPRHARRAYDKYSARGQATPVAIVLGVHPAIWFGSGFSTRYGIEELTLSGGLLREAVRTVPCETIDIDVPAEAEIVLEGEIVEGNYLEAEGPFGEVTGAYGHTEGAHVFRLKAITRRRDPIYYALHCGFPPTDTQSTTGLGIEVATFEHLRNVDGGMIDLLDLRCLTVSGLMMLVLKMRPRYEGQAKTALMAALSGPYQQPKIAVAVDDDIDAADIRQIVWSIASRVRAERDVVLIPNVRIWAIDNASTLVPGIEQLQRVGTKWMIDATKPPPTNPEERALFEMAMPLNYQSVNLKDFLP